MLHGRATECALIDDLIDGVRNGVPGTLLLRGEPGSGRTALLDRAAAAAPDLLVLRTAGICDDAPSAFAALGALLSSVAARVAELDLPGIGPLAGALGLREHPVPSRFLVADGLVTAFAHLALRSPVLCLVDDVQWVDRGSRDVLALAARHLTGPAPGCAIGVILAVEGDAPGLAGVPELRVGPLATPAGVALLREVTGGLVDGTAAERLALVAEGNPMALAELGALCVRGGGDSLGTVGAEIPGEPPVSAASILRRAGLRRIAALPVTTQRLLLVAALDGTGDTAVLAEAARSLRLDLGALRPAVDSGLVAKVAAGRLGFGHPIIRAAAGRSGAADDRRRCHRALADAYAGRDADRAAWHRAAAAPAGDDTVTSELRRAAARARARGAHDAAARWLERAAALTAAPDRAVPLLVGAAEDALRAGALTRAAHLARRARGASVDPALHARALQVLGRVQVRRGESLAGYDTFLDGGMIAEPRTPLATALLVEAAEAARVGADPRRLVEVARLARPAREDRAGRDVGAGREGGPGRDDGADRDELGLELVTGVAALVSADPKADRSALADVAARLRAAARATARSSPAGADQPVDRQEAPDPVALVRAASAAALLGDGDLQTEWASRAAALAARRTGDWDTFARALDLVAGAALAADPSRSEELALEGLRVAEEADLVPAVAGHLARLAEVAAVRGDVGGLRDRLDRLAALARRANLGAAVARGEVARAVLDLGSGREEAALVRLEAVTADPGRRALLLHAVPDLVEAAVRTGRPERAAGPYETFAAWAQATGSGRFAALAARCGALLCAGEDAAVYYTDALDRHGAAVLDAARTRLLLGEFLRRERQRVDARPHLSAAAESFERLGARPWAERARHELRAAGGAASGQRSAGLRASEADDRPTRAVPATAVNSPSDHNSATAATE